MCSPISGSRIRREGLLKAQLVREIRALINVAGLLRLGR